jgi:hypothetical protein
VVAFLSLASPAFTIELFAASDHWLTVEKVAAALG